MGFFDFLKKSDASAPAPALDEQDEISEIRDAELSESLDERFTDEGQIAKGGMGSIRRVFNQNLLRREAMKVLDPKLHHDRDEVRRFLEEAQITGQLDHPNIPSVHEVGEDASGAHYFTMKLVRGQTLEQLLTATDFSIQDDEKLFEVLQIFLKVCDAIAFSHSRGVVHCDLKPPNVMIGSFGQVYVMDWGISRVRGQNRTRRPDTAAELVRIASGRDHRKDEGRVMGTLGYMSPEQAHGESEHIDEKSDVFALGALLYRILTGRAPYVGVSPEETWELAKAGVVEDPQKLVDRLNKKVTLPPRLCRVAMKAMRKDKDRRYPGVADLQREVAEFVRGAGRYPTVVFEAGQRVISEGEPGDAAFVILKGRARAFRQENGQPRTLRQMGPGDVFGETAILTERPRTASVEALEELTVVVVNRDGLEREMGQTFWVGHILKALAERFRDVDERLQRESNSLEARATDRVLRYVAFHGLPAQGDARQVVWTELLRHLKRELKVDTVQAMALASGVRGLRVDERADTASLVPTDLPAVTPPPPPAESTTELAAEPYRDPSAPAPEAAKAPDGEPGAS